MTESRITWMLVALCAANFTVTSSGSAMAPFLQAIADDLAITLPAVAHLFAIQAIAWGGAALVAGAFSLRLGRRSVLVASLLLMGATRVGFVWSPMGPGATTALGGAAVLGGAGGGAGRACVARGADADLPSPPDRNRK